MQSMALLSRGSLRNFNIPASFVLILFLVILSQNVKAHAEIMVKEHSFTNSPQLISPLATKSKNHIRLLAKAKFMNDCYAEAGVQASFIDLANRESNRVTQRIILLHQKVPAEGCPDMYSPAYLSIEILSKADERLDSIILLDHSGREGDSAPLPPPTSIPISDSSESNIKHEKFHSIIAQPLGGESPRIPTLSSVQIKSISRVPHLKYTVEITMSSSVHLKKPTQLSVWRYETRIGSGEPKEPPVIDWLVIQFAPCSQDSGKTKMETKETNFQITLEGARGFSRLMGLVNPIANQPAKNSKFPFNFFKIQ